MSVDSCGTDRRLATRDSQAADAEWCELPHDLRDFLVREDALARQPRQPLERHAIRAAKVAAIGHRDAQILDAPPELVQRCPRSRAVLRRGALVRDAARVHPLARAVHVRFALPDRESSLHFLDHESRRLVRVRAMRMRDDDRDARRLRAPACRGDAPPTRCAIPNAAAHSLAIAASSRSAISPYALYSMPVTARPSFTSRTCPRNTHGSAIRRVLHLGEQRGDVDRAANDRGPDAHPPATGGMIATSSPLSTR